MKRLLANYGEKSLHDEIVGTVAHYRADIYRKVRIADCIDISKLADRSLASYALQAHFDICVCGDDGLPAFAFEYDGGGHDSKHDAKKNALAQAAGLALFRVDETLLNRTRGEMTFLQYLVHTWFLGLAFLGMQERGELPYDEPFMMSGFLKDDAKHIFDSDFDFRAPALRRLLKTIKPTGKLESLHHLRVTQVLFRKGDTSIIGYASVPVGDAMVYGRSRLDIGSPCLGELEELPFGWAAIGDYAEGMVIDDLVDAVAIAIQGGGHTNLTRATIFEEIEQLKRDGYRLLRGFGGADTELFKAGTDAMPLTA